MSSPPSLFASSRPRINVSSLRPRPDTPEPGEVPKRVKSEHDTSQVLSDLGARCLLCMTLPLHCAMLRSTCTCQAMVCFNCYAKMVTVTGAAKDNHTHIPANRVSFREGVDFWNLESLCQYTLYKCPSCRTLEVKFKAQDSREWNWFRQLYMSTVASISVQDVKIGHIGHDHATDAEWVKCPLSVFQLKCPAECCPETISINTSLDVRSQVDQHIHSLTCQGQVVCVFCSRFVSNDDDCMPRWHCSVAVRHMARHYALHRKLYAMWVMHHEDTVASTKWWSLACELFKPRDLTDNGPIGGSPATFPTRGSPLQKVVNGATHNSKWCDPWLTNFMSSMQTHFLSGESQIKMCELAFPMFFNAGYEAMPNEEETF